MGDVDVVGPLGVVLDGGAGDGRQQQHETRRELHHSLPSSLCSHVVQDLFEESVMLLPTLLGWANKTVCK